MSHRTDMNYFWQGQITYLTYVVRDSHIVLEAERGGGVGGGGGGGSNR